ncbi:MAG: cytochrome c [Acidobacteria bacterium]|nr:cytochrome c [Acidobacteriota bacterium]
MTQGTASLGTRLVVAVGLVFVAVATFVVYDRLLREAPAPVFESDEEHFLYGSIGNESTDGIPYWVWLVLPRVFPDLLPGPGGYSTLGLLSKDGNDLPLGFSKVTIGYPRVAMNCAFCHVGSVRAEPGDLPTIVPGAPAHQVAAQRYTRFLMAAASDGRFTAANILGEINRNYRLSAVDRLLYRFIIIPETRARLLRLKEQTAWMDGRPDWGHGRADVLNPMRFHRLGRPVDSAIGTADMMPLWDMADREAQGLFWNGSQGTLMDAVVTSAIAAGTSRTWLDADTSKWEEADLLRVLRYVADLNAPAYPFAIDKALAAAGQPVFAAECAQCHATDTAASPRAVDTDRDRLAAWTADASAALDAFGARRDWKPAPFESGDHYAAVPLGGVWMRAPYLHNGSVPSLAALLEPPVTRPARFWRGYDVYDPDSVGFVSDGSEARRLGSLYDTSQAGNTNVGHNYGTSLSAEARRALLEYLKTL